MIFKFTKTEGHNPIKSNLMMRLLMEMKYPSLDEFIKNNFDIVWWQWYGSII